MAGPCAVFMGNLNDECTKSEVCSMIVYVFNEVLGINIKKDNVNVSLSYHSNCFTATIFVRNEIYQKLVVESLDQTMVPSRLIKKGRRLRIDYFHAGHEKTKFANDSILSNEQDKYSQNHDEFKVVNYRKRMRRKRKKTADSQASTLSVQNVAAVNGVKITKDHHSSNPSGDDQRIHSKTFSNKINRLDFVSDQLDKVDYLIKGQQLGNENRMMEFKRGGGDYLKKVLKTHVGKYISGFLNSSGGTLLVGVDDKGFVQGVSLEHKEEDLVRIAIDEIINAMEPAVPPNVYSISFIPVRDDRTCNLKVIKITVSAGTTTMLYSSPSGDVFIRRDGSLQGPLKGKDLQEMFHMKIEEDYEKKEADLRKQIDILERQLEDVSLGHTSTSSGQTKGNKSVVCIII
ncbi:uncharacterized protein [Antedon mediterranea]|uniref:uncharacterized protein n=1 Tax=Antedon mediterranea TaxID=105859 RepID=UPI003AF8F6AF